MSPSKYIWACALTADQHSIALPERGAGASDISQASDYEKGYSIG